MLDYSSYLKIPAGYHRRDEIVLIIADGVDRMLSAYEANTLVDRTSFAEETFELFFSGGALRERSDPFAGSYYVFVPDSAAQLRGKYLSENDIHKNAVKIGPRFYSDVFRAALDRGVAIDYDVIEVPAADRVVKLSDNQIANAEVPLEELIRFLERDNGSPDQPGLRERLLGQIKAGRELIRSGEFRAYLLYVTLVRALAELMSRYGNPTIAALANALLGAVVSNMMQV